MKIQDNSLRLYGIRIKTYCVCTTIYQLIATVTVTFKVKSVQALRKQE